MVVKVNLDRGALERVERLAPLAARAAVVRRLVELGLEAVEKDPARLVRPVAVKEATGR